LSLFLKTGWVGDQSDFCLKFGSNWKSLGIHRLQCGDLLKKFNNLVPIGNHEGRQILELLVCQKNSNSGTRGWFLPRSGHEGVIILKASSEKACGMTRDCGKKA
jgi:hypothetical protein